MRSAQYALTLLTLSRAHSSARAADVAKLLLFNKRLVAQYPRVWSMALTHLTVTLGP